jgi:hypothetical protein
VRDDLGGGRCPDVFVERGEEGEELGLVGWWEGLEVGLEDVVFELFEVVVVVVEGGGWGDVGGGILGGVVVGVGVCDGGVGLGLGWGLDGGLCLCC